MTTLANKPRVFSFEDAQAALDYVDDLRERCYTLARLNDGELMGDDAWLRFAFSESDMNLYLDGAGITCSGSCFSSQSQDTEWFNFTIPFSAI